MQDIYKTFHKAHIVIEPTVKARAELRDIRRMFNKQKRNLKFIANDQLHITLQFLSERVSTENLDIIVETLIGKLANTPVFDLTISNLKFGFKGERNPTAVNTIIAPTPELRAITRDIHNHNKQLKIRDLTRHKDHAKLIHHMAIARTKRNQGKSLGRAMEQIITNIDFKPIIFEVDHVALLTSTFSKSGGTIYKKMADFPLKK